MIIHLLAYLVYVILALGVAEATTQLKWKGRDVVLSSIFWPAVLAGMMVAYLFTFPNFSLIAKNIKENW